MEVLLCLALVVLITSVGVLSISSASADRQLMQATTWYETLLRYARSEAMVAGRPLRLSFDSTTGQPQLLGESDPLLAPGVFDLSWTLWSDQPPEQYAVTYCRRDDTRGQRQSPAGFGEEEEQDMQSLTFHPDGSCDWAELEVRSITDDAAPVLIVQINGFTGSVSSQTVSPSQRDQ